MIGSTTTTKRKRTKRSINATRVIFHEKMMRKVDINQGIIRMFAFGYKA